MKKVLFVATVVKAHIMVFHIPFLKWFKENGYETYVCARNDYENKEDCIIPYCDYYFDLPFERSPIKVNNFTTYKQLKEIIETNQFDIIHCHTPTGGALTRLAAQNVRKNGSKVIYTAHGFHFFKGAPIKNWLIYYPIECLLARYTDVLITINKEDYARAKKTFKANRIEYIPGVGVDNKRFSEVSFDKLAKRRELGISEDNFVLISVGELNKNKNHKTVLRAISKLKNQNIQYLICGQGILENHLKKMVKELGLEKQVHFLGFRSDIAEICKIADTFVFLSYREGLSLALMEAMASGLPVVCSDIRGNSDLIEHEKGGYLYKPDDEDSVAKIINKFNNNPSLRMKLGKYNLKAVEKFGLENVKTLMNKIYKDIPPKN